MSSESPIYPSETFVITFTFTDQTGSPFDPSTVTGNIYDPTETSQYSFTMAQLVQVSTGIWTLQWTLPSTALAGVWVVKLVATYTLKSLSVPGKLTFNVASF